MEIEIIKDTEDIRENRSKTLVKGTKMVVTKELGDKYIKAKTAKIVEPKIKVIKPIKNADDLEKWEENN